MKKRYHPPVDEWLSFAINHQIIFFVGVAAVIATTIYVFRNSARVKIEIFVQAVSLLLGTWFAFYLVIKSEPNEQVTALGALWGTILPVLIYSLIQTNKRQ